MFFCRRCRCRTLSWSHPRVLLAQRFTRIRCVLNQAKHGCSLIHSKIRIHKNRHLKAATGFCFEMPSSQVGICPAGGKPKAGREVFDPFCLCCMPARISNADAGCTQRAGFPRCRSRGAKEAKEAKGEPEVFRGRKAHFVFEKFLCKRDGRTRQAVCSAGTGGFQMPAYCTAFTALSGLHHLTQPYVPCCFSCEVASTVAVARR